MKKFITGYFVGAVSLIPGISGGTILFISNEFENFITILTSKKSKNEYMYLLVIISGIILGAISTSKIVEYLFIKIPYETLIMFTTFLLLSINKIIKETSSKYKLSLLYLFFGSLIIMILSSLITNISYTYEIIPDITISFLIIFIFSGLLDGFITILPGISGSMVMMILRPYYLYKSF